MGSRILALIEDNIATRFLVDRRLAELGHHLEIVSDADIFAARIRARRFDWLLVDGEVARASGKRLVGAMRNARRGARIAWLGRRPRHGEIAVTAHFPKPISYAALSGYFSTPVDDGDSKAESRGHSSDAASEEPPSKKG